MGGGNGRPCPGAPSSGSPFSFPPPCFCQSWSPSRQVSGSQPPGRQRPSPSLRQSRRHTQLGLLCRLLRTCSAATWHSLQIPQRMQLRNLSISNGPPSWTNKIKRSRTLIWLHRQGPAPLISRLLSRLQGRRRCPGAGRRHSALPGASDSGPGQCLGPQISAPASHLVKAMDGGSVCSDGWVQGAHGGSHIIPKVRTYLHHRTVIHRLTWAWSRYSSPLPAPLSLAGPCAPWFPCLSRPLDCETLGAGAARRPCYTHHPWLGSSLFASTDTNVLEQMVSGTCQVKAEGQLTRGKQSPRHRHPSFVSNTGVLEQCEKDGSGLVRPPVEAHRPG